MSIASPFALADDGPDWHRKIRALLPGTPGKAPVAPQAALTTWVAQHFGADVVRSHRWSFTPGTGRALEAIFAAAPGRPWGAVLPAYQRTARHLPADWRTTCPVLPVARWSAAEFAAPRHTPAMLVVNPVHANPVASSLSGTYLDSLARWAGATGTWIVEDDAFRGLSHLGGSPAGEPLPLLRRIPERTIYLGSWTKKLGWPHKAGFVGMPHGAPFTVPAPDPASVSGLAELLVTGGAADLMAARRERFTRRSHELLALLRRFRLPCRTPSGGMHLLVEPSDERARLMLGALARSGLAGIGAAHFYGCGETPENFLRIAFSAVEESSWPGTLKLLDDILGEAAESFGH
ncbi:MULTISPECIES: hypothetical protein [unclassified Streptomyces]|uniref:hypothetical protein n=1 Tax=unclassified Streptomyces TaxID=2593676 RepID=UPI0004C0FD7E|nr:MULTISPECIES: hypothetical protein [unclassified Streptomyces]